MMTKLCNEYSNFQALLHLMLKWLIDSAVTTKPGGDGSRYFSLLNEILNSVSLDSDVANSVTR
jgi:hypothetical protein